MSFAARGGSTNGGRGSSGKITYRFESAKDLSDSLAMRSRSRGIRWSPRTALAWPCARAASATTACRSARRHPQESQRFDELVLAPHAHGKLLAAGAPVCRYRLDISLQNTTMPKRESALVTPTGSSAHQRAADPAILEPGRRPIVSHPRRGANAEPGAKVIGPQ